jgi:cellulose synthase/poly-beta-1,6-N-acetylglucosamine synthase-like glycosyltransferase
MLLVLQILVFVAAVYYALRQLACIVLIVKSRQAPLPAQPAQWPDISILVPARNEEANILRCLQSLAALQYPAGKMQILVGDDRSTDGTAAIIRQFIANKPAFQYVFIGDDLPGQRGKQNVLAQLAHHATGQILIVTDADIVVQPGWAQAVVRHFDAQEVGMVSGPTIVEDARPTGRLQQLDWAYGLSSMQAFAYAGQPVAAVGNNMAVTRAAYDAAGRYENMPFSITEDYRLYEHISGKGYAVRYPFYPEILNRSAPMLGLGNLLQQRKRWFKGGSEAPWHGMELLYGQLGVILLALLALIFLPWPWGMALFGVKALGDLCLLVAAQRTLRFDARALWYFPLHQLYFTTGVLFVPLFLYLPVAVNWKGRLYK